MKQRPHLSGVGSAEEAAWRALIGFHSGFLAARREARPTSDFISRWQLSSRVRTSDKPFRDSLSNECYIANNITQTLFLEGERHVRFNKINSSLFTVGNTG